MKRKIITTADGSHTIVLPELDVMYHSRHGAIQESMHVFIEAGLRHLINQAAVQPVNLFEMGFGTGLNAFLTAIEAGKQHKEIHYTAVEPHPLTAEEAGTLNYSQYLGHTQWFTALHQSSWSEDIRISDHFTLRKEKTGFMNFSARAEAGRFHLIYYDAFAPAAQPGLWTGEIFQKLHGMLAPNGILVTYCSKGEVRRAMLAAGFSVTKLPGPKGKREMLRAVAH